MVAADHTATETNAHQANGATTAPTRRNAQRCSPTHPCASGATGRLQPQQTTFRRYATSLTRTIGLACSSLPAPAATTATEHSEPLAHRPVRPAHPHGLVSHRSLPRPPRTP